MIDLSTLPPLKGKKALVTGIANNQSIAWGCAKGLKAFGADIAITYLNDEAKLHVEPLAKEVEASIFTPHRGKHTPATRGKSDLETVQAKPGVRCRQSDR